MEKKLVLSIEQMQHLQELGLELKETIMYWSRCIDKHPCAPTYYGIWELMKGNNAPPTVGFMYWKSIPAYTLQDVLDALPDFIDEYCLIIDMSFGVIRYDNLKRKDSPIVKETYFNNEDKYLIDAAYEMLCWVVSRKSRRTG